MKKLLRTLNFCKAFKIFKILRLSVCCLTLSALAAGCSTSLNDMMDSYNSNFESSDNYTKTTAGIAPGEAGFSEEAMLSDKYFTRNDGTLCLYAPPRCSSYQWKITKLEEVTTTGQGGIPITSTIETSISCNLSNGTSMTTRAFSLYVPTSNLEVGTYRLKLTVKDKEGISYEDTCTVIIYFMN